MEDDKLTKIAMQIILHAGNARTCVTSALSEVERRNFAAARQNLKQADEQLNKAHLAQTDVIQNEAMGISACTPTLLYIHAQDTLMTINSEAKIAEQMIDLFESFYNEWKIQKEKTKTTRLDTNLFSGGNNEESVD
jgi:Phosphotransferase system cellobiose-specific component IIA